MRMSFRIPKPGTLASERSGGLEDEAHRARFALRGELVVQAMKHDRVVPADLEAVLEERAAADVVLEQLGEAALLRADRLVDRLRILVADLTDLHLAGLLGPAEVVVLGLGTARERVDEVGRRGVDVPLDHRATLDVDEDRPGVPAEEVLVIPVDVVVTLLAGGHAALGEDALGLEQRVIGVGAEVRQVEPAEHAMPVDVVRLRAPEVLLGLTDLRRGVEDAAPGELLGDDEHPFVQGVRLGVLGEEVPPGRHRHEGGQIVLQGVARLAEPARGGLIERPLAHLGIRAARQVHPAGRLVEDPGVLERRGLEEVGGREGGEELLEPAVLVDALERSRPRAELLAVIGVDHELRTGGVALAELLDRRAHVAEGDEVSEPHVPGIDDERESLIFGDERLAELVAAQAGLEEVLLVEGRVGHAGLGEQRRQVRLPDPFGQPGPERTPPEHPGHPVGERPDLPDRVAAGDADEDRLVVPAGEELDLPPLHQIGEVADDIRSVPLEPVEERPGEVEGRLYFGVPIERGHERRIGALGHVGEHVGEVPCRLVLVEHQSQTQTIRRHLRGSLPRRSSTVRSPYEIR